MTNHDVMPSYEVLSFIDRMISTVSEHTTKYLFNNEMNFWFAQILRNTFGPDSFLMYNSEQKRFGTFIPTEYFITNTTQSMFDINGHIKDQDGWVSWAAFSSSASPLELKEIIERGVLLLDSKNEFYTEEEAERWVSNYDWLSRL